MIHDSTTYWNRVAKDKTFTHPLKLSLIQQFVSKEAAILDYGCGYGRLVEELHQAGYPNTIGYDTSKELIKRGMNNNVNALHHIDKVSQLPIADNSLDCILLFAVLTCIPDNASQKVLINTLDSKLKSGGILYLSDYYIQPITTEVKRYTYLNDDATNFGVFTLSDGGTFRHHTQEWIASLLHSFTIKIQMTIPVKTMNGHSANAFQMIAIKP